jgi:hypothetical protein
MTRGLIHIGCVKMTPPSTRESPWLFVTLHDAREFSLISGRELWAVIRFDPSLYHVWPGGRAEVYPAEVREKWAARRPKNLGTSSGTSRESDFSRPASSEKRKG